MIKIQTLMSPSLYVRVYIYYIYIHKYFIRLLFRTPERCHHRINFPLPLAIRQEIGILLQT